jgi:hypothetical protein
MAQLTAVHESEGDHESPVDTADDLLLLLWSELVDALIDNAIRLSGLGLAESLDGVDIDLLVSHDDPGRAD